VAVQSIRTPVQVGDVAGNHLLVAAGKVTLAEVNLVGKVYDLAQKVGPSAEALDDTWNLLSARSSPPVVVRCGGFAGGFMIRIFVGCFGASTSFAGS